jgi:SAM-dependent methyltransferase
MRPEAYAEMRALEERHWWFRGRRALLRALLARVSVAATPRVLDAGCGTGGNLVEFGGVGVDPAGEAVAACRARGLDVVQASAGALPFADSSFDLLLATDVLEHVDDDVAALRELRRVAAPGAVLLVTVPAHPRLWSGHDEALHHRRRYRRAELLARVRRGGWEPVAVTWWNSLLLPVVAAVRTVSRRSGADHARDPGPFNGVLESVLRVEAWLVRRGVPLPAGVSLAVAAQPHAEA